MCSDALRPKRKVIHTNMGTHEVRIVEGESDFYGRVIAGDSAIGPELLLDALHPDDRCIMLDAFERCALLRDGEVFEYRLRAKHALGHWVLAICRATPIERERNGMVRVVSVEVEMFDIGQ